MIQFSNAAIIHQELLKTQVQKFDIELPVEKAITPPSSWFTQKTFHELDKVYLFEIIIQIHRRWIPQNSP